MRKGLLQSSLRTTAVLGLRTSTQALVLLLLTRLLGPGLYGGYAAVSSLAVVIGVLPSLGAGYVLLARIARDEQATADIWRYAWPLTVSLGLVLMGIYLPLAGLAVRTTPLPMEAIFWVGASELWLTPFTLLLSFALQAQERVPLSQLIQWLPMGLRVFAALSCFGLAQADRVMTYAFLQFTASLAGTFVGWLIVRRHVRLNWRPRLPTAQELRGGGSYALMHLVAVNPSELDKIVATSVVGARDAGIYAATTRVVSAAITPVSALLLSAQPRLFRQAHSPGRQQLTNLNLLVAALAVGCGAATGLMLAILSPVLLLLFGRPFAATAELMPWLAGAVPFLSLRLATGTMLVALGHPTERIGYELCGIATLIIGMLTLGTARGLHGLALAMIASEAIMAIVGCILVARHLRRPPMPSSN